MAGRDIVVIGGSAGAGEAILELLEQLPATLRAAVFVAHHLPPDAEGAMSNILARAGTLTVRPAVDGEPIRHGVVYVCVPDRHLVVMNGTVRLTRGPRENRWRPAIDTLFRSAAVAYGSRVIGIVMTGMLDDGTAGLRAIKQCGGVAMVQDPADAKYPEMPQSALDNVPVDHKLPVSEMGRALARLVAEPGGAAAPVPPELAAEARIAVAGAPVEVTGRLGEAQLICPDCGGPLHEQQEKRPGSDFKRYRCLVGHAFSPATLANSTRDSIESALWAAIRLFRQRANLLGSQSEREKAAGRVRSAMHYGELAAESLENARRLQDLAMTSLQLAQTPETSRLVETEPTQEHQS
jgi:two-component system chemotaxis response regulator CheB